VRAVVQRVARAAVRVDGGEPRRIGRGLVILLGVARGDTADAVAWLAAKLPRLRIFDDAEGRMNVDLAGVGGDLLVVSQFTLHGDVRKGTRPSWNDAAPPEVARPLYEAFVARLAAEAARPVVTGEFGAMMEVELVNDGPVTLVVDSPCR
jgi:D-tyrosyl-tRNA(Tyr) deacylase